MDYLPQSFTFSLLKFRLQQFEVVKSAIWVNLAPPLWKMVWGTISQNAVYLYVIKNTFDQGLTFMNYRPSYHILPLMSFISYIEYLSLHYQEIPSKHSTNLCKIIKMNSFIYSIQRGLKIHHFCKWEMFQTIHV